MPLYEFECIRCGKVVEVKMTIQEHDKRKAILCEKCRKPMKKVFSVSNFVVKGFNAKNLYSHKKPSKPKKEE